VHKGPPGGVGWRGPYAYDRWCCTSQYWPQWPPKYIVAKNLGSDNNKWNFWQIMVKEISLPGESNFAREKMTWVFPPAGLGTGIDARIEMETVPNPGGNVGVVWRVRFAFASLLDNWDYRSSTNVFTDFNMRPHPHNEDWSVTADLVSATLLDPPHIKWFEANWTELP